MNFKKCYICRGKHEAPLRSIKSFGIYGEVSWLGHYYDINCLRDVLEYPKSYDNRIVDRALYIFDLEKEHKTKDSREELTRIKRLKEVDMNEIDLKDQ